MMRLLTISKLARPVSRSRLTMATCPLCAAQNSGTIEQMQLHGLYGTLLATPDNLTFRITDDLVSSERRMIQRPA